MNILSIFDGNPALKPLSEMLIDEHL